MRRFDSMAHLKEAHLKERRAISVDPRGEEPVPAQASRQTQQWPQQQHDAHHQRTEAARHYEKKKVFHAVVRRHPFPDKATLEPGIRSGHSHLRSRPAVKADFRLLRWSLALLARFESAMTIALSRQALQLHMAQFTRNPVKFRTSCDQI